MNLDTDFDGDDGSAAPEVRSALAAFAHTRTKETLERLLNVFAGSRVLVPVIAVVDTVHDGVEKDSHMRQVEFTATDGRRALLAFTGTDSLTMWDATARPIPRRAFLAAQSVLEADFDALIVDIAGPVPVAIDGPLLARMAVGPDRAAALCAALDRCCSDIGHLPGVLSARYEQNSQEIRIFVEIDHLAPQLADDIRAALQDPALTVLLDVPLAIEVLPRVTPVR